VFGYKVPRPDEAMLIAGGHAKGEEKFRIVMGHGAFVLPVFRHASFLSLAMHEVEVAETCISEQGISLQIRAVMAFKVGTDVESITNAATRFLSDEDQMEPLVQRIFAGHLRSIVGSMTIEDIIQKRQTLASEVLDGSKAEMAALGLVVDALQIQDLDDGEEGYIKRMSEPNVAAVEQRARIAHAEANREASKAEQESAQQQAEYERDTAVKRATFQAETDGANAKAAQAGPVAEAQAQQELTEEQTKLQERQASLREKQLVTEEIKPAEAQAKGVTIKAEADAKATEITAQANADAKRLEAGALASEGSVQLNRLYIEQLPKMAEAIASGLRNANITVLNGSEGLSELTTGLIAQAGAIWEQGRTMFGDGNGHKPTHAEVQRQVDGQ